MIEDVNQQYNRDYSQIVSRITENNFPVILELSQDIYDAIQLYPDDENYAYVSLEAPKSSNISNNQYQFNRKLALGYLQTLRIIEVGNLDLKESRDRRSRIRVDYSPEEFFGFFGAMLDRKENLKSGKKLDKNTNLVIKTITCVEPRDGEKMLLIINGDYGKPIKCSMQSSYWQLFKRIAEGERIVPQKTHKGFLDYMNTNAENQIFTNQRMRPTRLFARDGYIRPLVKLEPINQVTYIRRKNKSNA